MRSRFQPGDELTLFAVGLLVVGVLVMGCTYQPPPTAPSTIAPQVLSAITIQASGPTNANQILLTVSATDTQGHSMSNVRVELSTSNGTLNPAVVTTLGQSGQAQSMLTSSRDATVTAAAGDVRSTATARAFVAPVIPMSLSLSASPQRPAKGEAVTLVALISNGGRAPFSYAWTFGDGQLRQTADGTIVHTYTSDGIKAITVLATDADGLTGSAVASVTVPTDPVVSPSPAPTPTASPSYSVSVTAAPQSLSAGESSTLTASATPQNGAPTATSYAWDCNGDGTTDATTAGNTTNCTYPTAGTIISRVTASSASATGQATIAMNVSANAPITVTITNSTPASAAVGGNVTFTASVSSTGSLPGGTLFRWEWDFDNDGIYDAVQASAASPDTSPTTTYSSTGVKTVRVRVTDTATGRVASATRTITIS